MKKGKMQAAAEEFLNDRYDIWQSFEKDHPKEEGDPNFIYYKGALELIQAMGGEWQRKDGKHSVYFN